MKKVKEMTVCMETGKVCFRVRSAYNQLIEVMQGIDALEAGEQNYGMAYEVAHTAMTAKKVELSKQVHKTCLNCEVDVAKKELKKAEKAEREAIRILNEVTDIIWYSLIEIESFSRDTLYDLWQYACDIDEDCIVANKVLEDAERVCYEARENFRAKQKLFDTMYPEDVNIE